MDPIIAATHADPYAYYAQLRAEGGLVFHQGLKLWMASSARAVAAVLPGATLQTCYQIHSAEAVTVTEPWPDSRRPHADALVTAAKGDFVVTRPETAQALFDAMLRGVATAPAPPTRTGP